MKLLNIGCGSTFHRDWVNIDIVSCAPEVRQYDIRKNLPYSDAEFDACYTSHLIEHLKQEESEKLLAECKRILKPQGIIRVVVPDLEGVVREYLNALEKVDSGSSELEANYDWMMLELYDQTVRSFAGGEMGRFLLKSNITNKDFIISRIGAEAENYWLNQSTQKSLWDKISNKKPSWFFKQTRDVILKSLVIMIVSLKKLLQKVCFGILEKFIAGCMIAFLCGDYLKNQVLQMCVSVVLTKVGLLVSIVIT